MTAEIVIVGQGPGRTGEDKKPFEGRGSGTRTAELMGVDDLENIVHIVHMRNVLDKFYGKSGKGDCFPLEKARKAAKKMRFREKTIIMAGRQTALAFGIKADYFEPVRFRGKTAYVMPHPSGINRWWNSSNNYAKARRFMRKCVAEATNNQGLR